MIKLDNICFRYPGSKDNALYAIRASINPGLYLLAGENGAGKTTLLHVIAGLLRPHIGDCLIDGVKSATTNPEEMGNVFLLEENMFFPGKTIREFATLHSRFYPNFSEEQFSRNLKLFGLSGDERIKSLSLGNLKKSQLAYILSLGVKLLLLDEPTNVLDIEGREIFRKILTSSMSEEQTIIISTHTVSDLETLFDGALIMKRAELLYAGTGDDIASQIVFEYAKQGDKGALYSENQSGRYLNIYPKTEEDEETRIDWRALYLALHGENSGKIISQLNKNTY